MLRHIKKVVVISIDADHELHMGELVNNYVVVGPALFLASPSMPLEAH